MKKTISIFCAAIIVLSSLFVLGSCSVTEDIGEVTETATVLYTESKTEQPKSNEEVLAYFNSLLNNVKAATPAVNYSQEISVSNSTIEVLKADGTEDDALKSLDDAAPGIKDLILTDIKKKSGGVGYGQENEDIFFVRGESWASALSVEDIASATLREVGDDYLITISFNTIPEESSAVIAKAFELRDKATVLNSAEFAKTSAYLALNDYTVEYSGCTISATVNRLDDTLKNVSYSKKSNVAVDATGLETFADYGEMLIKFELKDNTNFNFTWTETVETSPLDTTATEVAA